MNETIDYKYELDLILCFIFNVLHEKPHAESMVSPLNVEHKIKNMRNIREESRQSVINVENLRRMSSVGFNTAIMVTTHEGIRITISPFCKTYSIDHLDLYRKELKCHLYADWLQTKTKSIMQFTFAFILTNRQFANISKKIITKTVSLTCSLNFMMILENQ